MKQARVGIVLGSASDEDHFVPCAETLDSMGVAYEKLIASAHRTPDRVVRFASEARERGIKVIIGMAGLSAALPGVLAAHTTLPVIGVPVHAGPLAGMDALLAMVQMPRGIPVATVAIGKGGAVNAALLATSILAVEDITLAQRLESYREEWSRK